MSKNPEIEAILGKIVANIRMEEAVVQDINEIFPKLDKSTAAARRIKLNVSDNDLDRFDLTIDNKADVEFIVEPATSVEEISFVLEDAEVLELIQYLLYALAFNGKHFK